MIRVAVFDDNDSRRDGLKLLLNAMEDMECIGAFEDCRNVVEQVRNSKPDVVLMDINMPNVDGIEGLKLLKEVFPELKIIMQTIFEDEDKILASISAGADGYILKQKSPLKLIEGIQEVLNGGAPITSSIAGKILKLFSGRISIPAKGEKITLTKREREILQLLVEGYSYKMIASKCFITYATVNTHITHIYQKLQVKSVSAAVAKAIREGLV
jgi:DNA-binding NarL/FixJ family response regulator